MTQEWKDPMEPTPEQLAAYADGQLHGPDRDRVEGWLSRHGEAAAEVESYRRLAQLWETTSAPEPPLAAWDRTLDRIKDRMPGKRRSLFGLSWGGLGGLGAVAAAVLVVLLARPFGPKPQLVDPGEELTQEVPFPVATPGDVTIISMDVGDVDCLVVGQPPVEIRRLDLASRDDVKLLGQTDPEIRLEDWGSPMLVDPQAMTGTDRDR